MHLNIWRCLLGLALCLLLSACNDVDLYSNLTEKEGNEMLALLLEQNIPATKTRSKDTVKISVAQVDVARSIALLQSHGYPRDRFTHLGDIFQKQGLISSPLEERVRYTFGLSQMVAETLQQIDGVLAARVLIVLPEEAQFGKTTQPSSASVFIKYRPGLSVEEAIPKIKMIVQHSVDGLDYEKISVALFPTRDPPSTAEPPSTPASLPWLPLLLGAGLLMALIVNGYLFWRMRRGTNRNP